MRRWKQQLPLIHKQTGFTLVEMAVVLVIVGLMLAGLLMPLSGQMDQRNYSKVRADMSDIREALIGYGLSHGYLPCPAVSASNGSEDRAGSGACNQRAGFLPWAELGVPKLDSWSHLYRYSVTPAYSNSSTKISLTSSGDITIWSRDSAGALIKVSNDPAIPAVVVSFGKNGLHGFNDDGTQISDTSATNTDEDTNGSGTTTFFSRDYTEVTTGGGEFDDVVVWVSPNVYLNRMVTAGQLP
jgi:prepilin-type N-terminal cleavage/methylation domain-containing protein